MKKYRQSSVLISILLVIIGVVVIIWFTGYLGKIFVGMVSKADTSALSLPEVVEQTTSELLTLPGFEIWVCQVGVYKDQKKADLLVEGLRLKDWKPQIIKNDPFAIAIGLFQDKKTADLLGKLLAEDGIETWVKQEKFPALHYKISGNNGEKMTTVLKSANLLLSGTGIDDVKRELIGGGVLFSVGECPEDLQKLNDALEKILNKEYPQGQIDDEYRQDLLELFVEYQAFTTNTCKYFKN